MQILQRAYEHAKSPQSLNIRREKHKDGKKRRKKERGKKLHKQEKKMFGKVPQKTIVEKKQK